MHEESCCCCCCGRGGGVGDDGGGHLRRATSGTSGMYCSYDNHGFVSIAIAPRLLLVSASTAIS